MPFTLAALENLIREEWCAETAWSPRHWFAEIPSAGQCFSTAFVVKSLLGGQIIHAEVLPAAQPRQRHSWNRLPGGLELDLTREQFPADQQFLLCELPEELVWQYGGRQAELLLRRVEVRLGRTIGAVEEEASNPLQGLPVQ